MKRALAGRENDLLVLFHTGMTIRDIAKSFGVTVTTVRHELDRLGIDKAMREQVRRSRTVQDFEQTKQHPDFSFVLGMIWGVGSHLGDKFVIRHQKRDIIDRIYSVLKHARIPEPFTSSGRHVIQIGYAHPLIRFLSEVGWTGRKSEKRDIPKYEGLDMEAFVCGYIRVHHSLGWARYRMGKRVRTFLRLRTYGPPAIVEKIAMYLSEWTGVGRKNPHAHPQSPKMVTLEYSDQREVEVLCRFLGLKPPEKPEEKDVNAARNENNRLYSAAVKYFGSWANALLELEKNKEE